MPDQIENSMTVDWWWDEQEYRVPSRARMKRERQAYEEAERDGFGSGKYNSCNYAGECEDIM